MHKRKINETIKSYESRLWQKRKEYGLSEDDIQNLISDEIYKKTMSERAIKTGERPDLEFDNSVMIINDVHLPFERDDVIDVVAQHNDEITHLVIAGDLLDVKSISFFPKLEDWTLEQEMAYAHTWLTELRGVLTNNQPIILINGNHEERWLREIHNLRQKHFQKFMNPNLIEVLIDGFELFHDRFGYEVSYYPPIENMVFIPHWFINMDNRLIIAHPRSFSQVDGKMCENTVAHFMNRGEEFDVVVFGHTHKYSQMTVSRRGGKYAVENGCMCKPQEYVDSGRLNFTPQHYCYTIIKWDTGDRIDYNNIRVYHLEEDTEPIDVNFEFE